ncbi:SDR family NAD(P)-dependent oxidoreductase [Cupriavidus consociatus]|uniref:SDR family NAD(P)-dependent oxidoreductase n=1 Tax=Cupriavidus consociatus TaxID=2821357 RepID=UPI001AE128C8|nr:MULTISPECIES: SDR family NAD(P)-dependent oxidoreductase [unclassified Cupriavidus]MBP0619208.1 SDR family NAD(P)-dependent oxidoreductase [Cupriavidus sp. LEh25]MDK2655854.1 SDR family NAD(P)-dependent oxidoreductase [Cupriavidus sp. LEh21]
MTAHGKLTGKIALVTGASRGIGRAIAQRFAAEGALVVVTARRAGHSEDEPETLAETVGQIRRQGGQAMALAADLEDPAQRDNLVALAASAAGGLDILVNNAGMAEYSRVESMPLEVFDKTVEHYLRIPFMLSRAAIPLMRTRGAGWILNLGSVTALPPSRPYSDFDRAGGVTAYAAVKAAINRFTEGLAAELEPDNIAVNSVAPSTAIRTPGSERYIPDGYPTEPVEYLVETALALCSVPARLRTGHIAHSLHFPLAHGLNVRTLDGQGTLPPPEIPPWAHPGLNHDALSAR